VTEPTSDELHGEYENRYVAFIDILGFKDLIASSLKSSDVFGKIVNSLRQIAKFTLEKPLSGDGSDLKAQNFSDCIVVSANLSANGLWHLLLSIDDLFWSLSEFGVLLRGGTSKGFLYHDEDIVFGPALVHAYHLEQNVAVYPRIVVSRQVYEDAEMYAQSDHIAKVYYDSRLIRGDDGPAFLHVLLDLESFNYHGRSKSTPNAETHTLFTKGNNFCKALRNNLDAKMDEPNVYIKLKWFAEYFDREVVAGKESNESFFQPFFPKSGAPRSSWRLPFRSL